MCGARTASLSFPKGEESGRNCGADPLWSARVPLDPPVANEFNSVQTKQAVEGVGCRPGGLPHNEGKLGDIGKTKRHCALVRAAFTLV
jgi:hypothetical protein